MRGLAKAGWGVACSLWLALPALADLTENFDASTGVPAGWTDGGTANDSVSGHYQSSPNCRAMGAGDTLQTPAVDYPSNLSFFVAATVSELSSQPGTSVAGAVGDLAIGAATGVAVGLGAAFLLRVVRRAGWAADSSRGVAVLAFAVLGYAVALELGANGFVAAFVAGLAFGSAFDAAERDADIEFDAQVGEVLSWVIWFLFGAVMTTALEAAGWRTVVFAVAALTVVRIAAVALGLISTRLHALTVLFIGWFGPRGLASIVFGLIAYDALGPQDGEVVLAAVALTVLLSVVAHGISAAPLARRYGARVADTDRSRPEHVAVRALATRSRLTTG